MHFPYPCALKKEIEYPIEGRCCHINKGQREHARDFSFFWWRDQDIKQISSREDGDRFFFREIHSRGDIILLKQKKDFWQEKEKGEKIFSGRAERSTRRGKPPQRIKGRFFFEYK